jgi:hypothetical protein
MATKRGQQLIWVKWQDAKKKRCQITFGIGS